MKQSFFTSKNIPYLASVVSILLGSTMLILGYTSAEPTTRDPNIGASLCLLLGYFLIAIGFTASLVVVLVRKFKRSK